MWIIIHIDSSHTVQFQWLDIGSDSMPSNAKRKKIMKILHICTYDHGGAGLCCLRIHQALMKQGIDSRVLVLEKRGDCPEVYVAGCAHGRWRKLLNRIFNKILRLMHLKITKFNRRLAFMRKYGVYCSFPVSGYDISGHPLVKEADILHLHWINNFVDYPSFFKKVQKPMICTLHDENLFFGVVHNQYDIAKDALEKRYYKTKLKAIQQIRNLYVVFLSEIMCQRYAGHEMIRDRYFIVINNAVDSWKFHPIDKRLSRAMFGIDENSIVFSFVAVSLNDKNKGLDVLSKTLERMNIPNAMILAVGDNGNGHEWPLTKSTGAIYDTERLSAAYSCADYFVLPSQQEAFGQTLIEALACGVPIIAFPVDITGELITEKNGIRCNGFTSEDLEEGIRKAMNTSYDTETIRKDVKIGRAHV